MARAATDTLRDIAAGELVEDLGAAIRGLNQAISETDKGGEITLKLKMKPAGRGSGAVEVSYDIVQKMPKLPNRASIMWGTPEGDLLAQDPSQGKLDLKEVPTQPTELRQAS